MADRALTRHPETGEPIRRVILGGYETVESFRQTNRMDRTSSGTLAI